MNFQGILALVKANPIIAIIVVAIAFGACVPIARRLGVFGWYIFLIALSFVAASASNNVLYFYAFFLGFATAFAEIIGKFAEPIKAFGTREAFAYHLFNGLIAAFSLYVLVLSGASMNTQQDKLKIVLAAGLGSMLVLRSRFFSMKVGKEEIAFGPEQLVKVFIGYLEKAIDRARARSRVEFVKTVMGKINFDEVRNYTLTMLESAQTISEPEKAKLKEEVEKVHNEAACDIECKSYKLGFLLIDSMGEEFVRTLFGNPDVKYLIEAPKPTAQEGFFGRIKGLTQQKEESHLFFAYGRGMSTHTLYQRLNWDDSLAEEYLSRKAKKGTLKNYRLIFNKPSGTNSNEGLPNLELDLTSEIQGVLYELPKNVLKFYETDREKAGYHPEVVKVELDGKSVDAVTFVANSTGQDLQPSEDTLETMLSGAEEHNLDDNYIGTLKKQYPLVDEESAA
jgi:hypothetical protein